MISIASGSKGNCTLIMSSKTAILCDAGISTARISSALKNLGMSLSDLSGVVVTHEHNDHIAALPTLTRYVPVYAHELTARAIYEKQGVLKNYKPVDFYENGFYIGDIEVTPFRIPHDAEYPLGYTFSCENKRVSVATDMGVLKKNVYENVRDSGAVLLESNHDVEMLKEGSYPPYLKARILGNNGHLSNDAAALMAAHLVGTSVQTLVLGHISENNNTTEKALCAVKKVVDEASAKINLCAATQYCVSSVFEVK